MRTLEPNTNVWINADNKNPVWTGGKQEYGKKFNPRKPYHIIPKTYQDVKNHLIEINNQKLFAEDKYAILTGHIEDNKTGGSMKQQLKTLGKMTTKMQIEGKLETVLYSKVDSSGGENKYVLETQNNGYNTARSPMGLFEPVIENDYKFVLDKLANY